MLKFYIEFIIIFLGVYSIIVTKQRNELEEKIQNEKTKQTAYKIQKPEESKLIIEINGTIKKYKSYDEFIKDLPEYNTIKLFVKGSTEAEKVKSILNIYYKNDYKIIKMDL